MPTTLHVFVDEDDHEVTMQGWEFPDVIVGGKTYVQAETEFKSAVESSMRADYLQSLEKLQKCISGNEMNSGDKFFIELLNGFIKVLGSHISYDLARKINENFSPILDMYLQTSSKKSKYGKRPPGKTKEVIIS